MVHNYQCHNFMSSEGLMLFFFTELFPTIYFFQPNANNFGCWNYILRRHNLLIWVLFSTNHTYGGNMSRFRLLKSSSSPLIAWWCFDQWWQNVIYNILPTYGQIFHKPYKLMPLKLKQYMCNILRKVVTTSMWKN